MTKEKKFSEETSRAPVSQRGLSVKTPENAEMIGGKVSVTIDGKEIKVPLGTTIL